MAKLTATTTLSAAALVFLVVQLLLLQSAPVAFASPADVNIYNEIKGQVIAVNCGSFGEVPLVYGEHFGWGFKPSIWGYTKWTCGFRWRNKTQEFFVWVDNGFIGTVPIRPCKHCVWRVRSNGFYRDGKYGFPVLVHRWA